MADRVSPPTPMTPQDLADIKAWSDAATPGPWEQGVIFAEAPVNPGEGQWATWRDLDAVEPDLMWQVKHLAVGQCRFCLDGPPLRETTRETAVYLYRSHDDGSGKEYAGTSTRRITYHLHRVARNVDAPLEPIASVAAQRVVLDVVTESGETRLALSPADATFITKARAAVPRLVAEVERLAAEVQRLHEQGASRGPAPGPPHA